VKGGVLAIDGPSASGKSSTARAVAEAIGFSHLDSGSLYRGVTLVALREAARRGRADDDPLAVLDAEAILRAAEDRGLMLQPDGAGFAAYLEGEPVDGEIRGPRVTGAVSAVSAVPVVREWVNTRLRAMVRAGRDVVVDGRDIGTVVFPDADLKIFLTARPKPGPGAASASGGRRSSRPGSRPRPPHSLRATPPIPRVPSPRSSPPRTRFRSTPPRSASRNRWLASSRSPDPSSAAPRRPAAPACLV
jgi:cytidylate kinase